MMVLKAQSSTIKKKIYLQRNKKKYDIVQMLHLLLDMILTLASSIWPLIDFVLKIWVSFFSL